MGVFDRFRKKEEPRPETKKAVPPIQPDKDSYTIYYDGIGRIVIEYHEAKPDFKKGYDSTRIIIDRMYGSKRGHGGTIEFGREIRAGETFLYDIYVSWYGEGLTRSKRSSHVIAGVNPRLMTTSPDYLEYVVKFFLDPKRVNEYMESSMMSEEELKAEYEKTGNTKRLPCGRYIGHVTIKDNKYLERRI